MADRIAVKKFPGVFYRESVKMVHNGKPDKSFCFCYDHQGKKHWETVGWASRGITAAYANQVRIDVLNKLRPGENPALLSGRKYFTFVLVIGTPGAWKLMKITYSEVKKDVAAKVPSSLPKRKRKLFIISLRYPSHYRH